MSGKFVIKIYLKFKLKINSCLTFDIQTKTASVLQINTRTKMGQKLV